MTKFALRLAAAAGLAFCAAAGAAQAGDLSDGEGYGSQSYRRQPPSNYCYSHPDDARCDPDARAYEPKGRAYSGGATCMATTRAAGKRNLFPAFARNSAIFAWQREVRAVHGDGYASWPLARRATIQCGQPRGALTACVAVAKPCRP